MNIPLILTLVALAAGAVGVALMRWPRVSCPTVALAAAVLLTQAGHLAVAGEKALALGSLMSGVVAGAWAAAVGVQYSERLRAGREAAEVAAERDQAAEEALAHTATCTRTRRDLSGYGHTVTVERLGRDAARQWAYTCEEEPGALVGRLAIVERADGRLVKVCAVVGDGLGAREVLASARSWASGYGARYLSPADYEPVEPEDLYPQHAVAVDNIAGGAR